MKRFHSFALLVWLSLFGGLPGTCRGNEHPAYREALPDPPPWAGSTVGRSDEVLSPWTPVVAEGNTISCWGREHQWGNLPFPNHVSSQDRELLSRPIGLSVTVQGESLSWAADGEAGAARRTTASGTAARIQRSVSAGPLALRGEATVAFDGMMRIDFVITPGERVTVDRFIIDIPVRAEHATLYHYWPLDGAHGERTPSNSGARKPITSHFRPLWWLGDEEGGLIWFAESDRHWMPVASRKCIEVVPGDEEVVLRLRIWDEPTMIDRATRFTMGLMATPVKPWPGDWHKQFISGNVDYDTDGAWFNNMERSGVTILQWGSGWSGIQSYVSPSRPDDFRRINREAQKRGMRIVPYFGFEISDAHPHYDRYHQEVRVAPFFHRFAINEKENPAYSKHMPYQTAYAVCYRSHWADQLLEGITETKKQYGIDGVYMDATTTPWECANRAHGCGYIARNGAIRPTFPIFAVRDTVRRIRTIFPEERGGLVLAHNSTCMMMPTLSFASCTMNGESLVSQPRLENTLELLSLATYRAEYMAHNWGVPHMMLSIGHPITEQELLAIGLIHDVVVRDELHPKSLANIAPFKRVFREFPVDGSEWSPYWRNQDLVEHSHPDQVKVSCYRNREGEWLFVVANLGNEDLGEAWLELRAGDPVSSAEDAVTGEALDADEGRITLPLPRYDPRLILAHD